MSVGKSTIAEILAAQLALPRIPLDDLRWDYYAEIGYDQTVVEDLMQGNTSLQAVVEYWKPFEAHAVERVLQDHDHGVLDFGGGHSVHADEALFARVQAALKPYPNVILLLPSPEAEASINILNARVQKGMLAEFGDVDPYLYELNRHFVTHPSNQTLAKQIVYTNDDSPETTVNTILALIGR